MTELMSADARYYGFWRAWLTRAVLLVCLFGVALELTLLSILAAVQQRPIVVPVPSGQGLVSAPMSLEAAAGGATIPPPLGAWFGSSISSVRLR